MSLDICARVGQNRLTQQFASLQSVDAYAFKTVRKVDSFHTGIIKS